MSQKRRGRTETPTKIPHKTLKTKQLRQKTTNKKPTNHPEKCGKPHPKSQTKTSPKAGKSGKAGAAGAAHNPKLQVAGSMLLLMGVGSSMDARAEPKPRRRALAVGRVLSRAFWPQQSTPMKVALAVGGGIARWPCHRTGNSDFAACVLESGKHYSGEAPNVRAGRRGCRDTKRFAATIGGGCPARRACLRGRAVVVQGCAGSEQRR